MPSADQVRPAVSLQQIANGIGLKSRDLTVARMKVDGRSRRQIANELGMSHRAVMHALHAFAQVHQAANMTPEEVLTTLEGGYAHEQYTPVAQRYQRRADAQQKTIDALQDELARKAVIVDAVVDGVLSHVGRYTPRPYSAPNHEGRGRPHYAILELSDWQMGSYWTANDVAGLGEASTPILTERVRLLGRHVLRLTQKEQATGDVRHLVINWLGDFVEGEIIFRGQGVHIDTPTSEQMWACASAARELLESLLPYYETITCYCVRGNHGRMSAKKGEQHPKNNWDQLLYQFLAGWFRDEDRLKWCISEGPWMAYTLPLAPRFNHVILHGDDIPNNLGIPYYGINRESAKMATLANIPVHYIHMGHFHAASTLDNMYGEKIINGCLTGPSPFSTGPLKTGSVPRQWFLGFHPEHGAVWHYPVYLAQMPEPSADEHGVYTPHETGIPTG